MIVYLTTDRFLKAKTQRKRNHIYCIKIIYIKYILFINLRYEFSSADYPKLLADHVKLSECEIVQSIFILLLNDIYWVCY